MTRPRQIPLFLTCVLAAGLASFAFDPPTAARFSAYGAGLPPASMLALTILFGSLSLWLLDRRGFFTRPRRASPVRLVAPALGFAAAAIAIDLAHPYGRDINVALPQALLFYPAIAMVAETAFHLVPLALVFGLTRRAWLAIPAAALIEPAFQVLAGLGPAPHWADIATGLNILAISLVQLHLFRRHGFGVLLGFRLAYYLLWHIAWGAARLPLLF